MAIIKENGNITARCIGCLGALSSYEWLHKGQAAYGIISQKFPNSNKMHKHHVLLKCGGCGKGGLAIVDSTDVNYPHGSKSLRYFHQESALKLKIPSDVPDNIEMEFREAEKCMSNECLRAAGALFRSVLDKTLRENGYKVKKGTTLEQQIDAAVEDGSITKARGTKAHNDIRVLGNDILHDEWKEINSEDIEECHKYTQRILEDFYDDRKTTLNLLIEAGRLSKSEDD